jgi:Tol biopolymer transport system component
MPDWWRTRFGLDKGHELRYSKAVRIGLFILLAVASGCSGTRTAPGAATSFPASADEPRLVNLRQLTNGGENAEAYFSADGRRLIFQSTRPPEVPCDQIFSMNLDGRDLRRLSTGAGRTTCGYFFPGRDRILYSSTHHVGPACPAPPDMSRGYVWALYDYDIYSARSDGTQARRLFGTPGYDAEATISPDGRKIVFTSTRDGDLDLYVMDLDGGNVQRLTTEVGYDGGAFFSADSRMIVYRAHHPSDPRQIEDYRTLLAQNLVRPTQLDIFVMNADGSGKRQVTRNGAANFAPFFHPNGRQIIFSSNLSNPRGRNFDLYLINLDGSGLEQVTTHGEFDGFPMFSQDGRRLVFASNRGAARPGETNIFLADWVDAQVKTQ